MPLAALDERPLRLCSDIRARPAWYQEQDGIDNPANFASQAREPCHSIR